MREVNMLGEILAFERWCENGNHLSTVTKLIWYELLLFNNKCCWEEWFQVDNLRLMTSTSINTKSTLIRNRDKLIEAGLIEYRKGKKGNPNKYRFVLFGSKIEPQTLPQVIPQTLPQVRNINKHKTETETIKKKAKAKKEVAKTAYGEFSNVLLSDEEMTKLAERVGTEQRDLMIERLGNYIASTGKKYASHYATILSWMRKDEANGINKSYVERGGSKTNQTEPRKSKYDALRFD